MITLELSPWLVALLVPPILFIEGLFSGAEIALLSVDRLELQKQSALGNRGARLALELAAVPERILSTTLVMTCACVVSITSLIELVLSQEQVAGSSFWAIAITSPLVVIFGELIPKTVSQRYNLTLAPRVAYAVTIAFYLLYPITRVISLYTAGVSRFVGPIEEMLTGRKRTTRDELRSMLTYSKRESEIKSSEKKMIRRILDFKDSEAKHALIPLVRIEAIEDVTTVRETLEKFEHHRHSRMPVYSERVDNIVGVLEVSDLFSAVDLQQPIRNYMSSAYYVAETQALDDLLFEMRREDLEMVVVVDEHGGAIGILTLEDIVEEVVGEIRDEYDSEATPYRQTGDAEWMVLGRIELETLNEALKLDLPQGNYETLAGFLLQQFGRIPETRDELYFDTPSGTHQFIIHKANERRIESVLIKRVSKPTPAE